ncbi:MAG TPA: dihydropyrimidinase [Solirubrobacterales bacterium]|nr:dihydropyrimidinase [Solirubrobacterales bacterium]
MSLLVKGGRVVTAELDFVGDVLVEGGKVRALGASLDVEVERTIDASGRYVLPGCVDVHTHMDVAFQGVSACDDFTSGTIAAAFGGTTTLVDFAEQPQGGGGVRAGLEEWHGKLERAGPVVDVGFHIIVHDLGGDVETELLDLPRTGVTTLKLHQAYPGLFMLSDEDLFRCMQIARRTGALAMVHAENGGAIEVLIEQAREAGHGEPVWHARTRPPLTEVEAIGRAIALAELAGCPLYVVHVSCAGSVETIAAARSRGLPVWGEACVHHLFTDEADLERPDFEGAKFVFTPPPRGAADRERLWAALADGAISTVSTDHFPNFFADRRALGEGDFSKIPNGTGGVEERLMLLHHHGVGAGRFSLNRMVQLLATEPARLLGLYPKKGTIAVGGDADLVLFDPGKEVTITAPDMHSRSDYTIYEGYSVKGAPETVLVRGEVVVEDGELQVEPGFGEYVARAPFGQLR